MNKELVKYFVNECKRKQEETREWNSNHIEMDNWFNYSGKTEEDSADYKNLMGETKAVRGPKPSRKEYFREYWRKRHLKSKSVWTK